MILFTCPRSGGSPTYCIFHSTPRILGFSFDLLPSTFGPKPIISSELAGLFFGLAGEFLSFTLHSLRVH